MEKMQTTIITPFGELNFNLKPEQLTELLNRAICFAGGTTPAKVDITDSTDSRTFIACPQCGELFQVNAERSRKK